MEGAYAILTGKSVPFSEQQLIDCVKEGMGCQGGWSFRCFEYYMTSKPMAEADYPYLQAKQATCNYD